MGDTGELSLRGPSTRATALLLVRGATLADDHGGGDDDRGEHDHRAKLVEASLPPFRERYRLLACPLRSARSSSRLVLRGAIPLGW